MTLNLIVMVKEPRPGRVKSRLAKGIGKINAKWWYLHQCRRLFRNLADPRWQLHIAVTPDVVGMQSRVWPSGLSRLPQGLGTEWEPVTPPHSHWQGGQMMLPPAVSSPAVNTGPLPMSTGAEGLPSWSCRQAVLAESSQNVLNLMWLQSILMIPRA